MTVAFQTVDVFTTEAFGGNPLAVIADARGMSGEQMQRIAGEFNLSETTFVLPPKQADHTAEVRIFTPRSEMPFAGHPNVGTAFVLARRGDLFGKRLGERLVFEEKAGLVPIDIMTEQGAVVGATLTSPQPLSLGDQIAVEAVAAACGLSVTDIKTDRHRPLIASCGTPFALAEVVDLAALGRAAPRGGVLAPTAPRERVPGLLVYARQSSVGTDIQARMFAPLNGIPEDPATGSANVALAGLLAALDARSDFDLATTIAQGVEFGRPSFLQASAQKRGGVVTATGIGGRCVPMMEGVLEVAR